jgi:polyisoprenoid-binding protein YceI
MASLNFRSILRSLDMRKLLIALPLIAAVPLLAQQLPSPPGKTDPALVKAGNYMLEGNHTQVIFAYDHFGLTNNMGLLSGGKGMLALDPAKLSAASVSVEMPVNTIHTTIAKLDSELQGPKFFNAAKFPVAKFVSTAVVPTGSTTADIMGNLTIHGITKPVTLKASFAATAVVSVFGPKSDNVAFNATTEIKRSDFGLGNVVPLVGDAVSLKIVAAFTKAAN